MSSPRPPRRRRIAGERRRAAEQTAPGDGRATGPDSTHPAAPPPPPAGVSLDEPSADEGGRGGGGRFSRFRTTGAGRSASRPRLLVLVPLLLLTVAGLAYLVAMVVGVPRVTDFEDLREAEQARIAAESAPSVAERAAEAILAYDHRTIDADRDGAQRFMTDEFAEEYGTTFDRSVKPAARNYRATVAAEVQGSAVVRADADEVKVLLFVDQTTRSTAHQRPQVALNRVEFVMAKRDGDWLVDDISSY